MVIDRGHSQGLAVFADRENEILACESFWDEAANRDRYLVTPPARRLLAGAAMPLPWYGGFCLSPSGRGTCLVDNTSRSEIAIFHSRALSGPARMGGR